LLLQLDESFRRESREGVVVVRSPPHVYRDVTSSITQTISSRLGRGTISVAISLLILAVAAFTLYGLLHEVDFGKVVGDLAAQPVKKIAAAGAFVIAGYVTLTLYDLFALRTLGWKKVPYSVAALASFTSSTIGHSLGAAVLTGGLIRLRIYSVWGLTVLDVAKIAFVTGMTFLLGNAVLLGLATAYTPYAATLVDHLPVWLNRAIGLAGLSVILCYLIWLAPRPRVVGRSGWRLVLPNLRSTLLQIGIGVLDLSLVTCAMYALLPPNSTVGFASVLIAFLTATMLGTVSHAPGGLGVIEATMLVGLPEFQREELLAALLTFRALYFVLPLLLATLSLAFRELRLLARPEADRRTPGE
jgi:glycosyltransferase 2 family protein